MPTEELKLRGPGRPRGSRNRRTLEALAAAEQGLKPLDFLLSVMWDPTVELAYRLEAAKAAAPYVHPKLSQIEVQATTNLRALTDEECRAELVELLKDPEVRELWIGALPEMTVVKGIAPSSGENRSIR